MKESISLDGSFQLFHWEAIILEVLVDGLEESQGHIWFPVENPEVAIAGVTNDGVSIVLVQPHNPVVTSQEPQAGNPFYFELGPGVVLVFAIGVGMSDSSRFFSLAVALVVDSDGVAVDEGVVGSGPFAVVFVEDRNGGLFVPNSQVFMDVNVRDSVRGITSQVGNVTTLHVG
jgi:hypothetical protein